MILENYSLKKINTFNIDVNAKYFCSFSNIDELKNIFFEDKYKDLNKFILGSGSNLLFTKDFDGIILKNNLKGIEIVNKNGDFYIKSFSGELLNDVINFSIEQEFNGLENLSAIPGTVGGAVFGNAGAYGVEIKDVIFEVEVMDINSGDIIVLKKDDCKFDYRSSIFKTEKKYVILSVVFKINKNKIFNIDYADIKKEIETSNIEINSKNIGNIVSSIRSRKLPDLNTLGCAGSFFKNPIIDSQKFNFLKSKFPNIISYDLNNGNYKLAAGWLIDQCGLKGKIFNNNVGCYEKQALVIVNYGNATGKEIYNFSSYVIDAVKEKFNVLLEREVEIL